MLQKHAIDEKSIQKFVFNFNFNAFNFQLLSFEGFLSISDEFHFQFECTHKFRNKR